jgi:hypothetical protein
VKNLVDRLFVFLFRVILGCTALYFAGSSAVAFLHGDDVTHSLVTGLVIPIVLLFVAAEVGSIFNKNDN